MPLAQRVLSYPRLPLELMRVTASRASDGRDSWKVTAVQTLDLCLVGDFGLSRSEGGCRRSDDVCQASHVACLYRSRERAAKSLTEVER